MRAPKMSRNTKISFLTGSVLVAILGFNQTAIAEDNSTQEMPLEGGVLEGIPDPSELEANEANLIFIRPIDNDSLQTSANIGIDGRYHASLQPGYYSTLRYCTGQHNISIGPTYLKTNDLTNPYSTLIDLPAQQNHYLYINIDDETSEPKLSKLDPDYAKRLISTQSEQKYHVSRVVADCVPITEQQPEVKVEVNKPINLQVLFEFDRAVVLPVFNQQIAAVANFLQQNPDSTAVIEGHTDNYGPASYNMGLSKRRAEAVKQELVNKYDINPNRLQTESYGETRPIDTNDTDEGRQNNRRVVATVISNK